MPRPLLINQLPVFLRKWEHRIRTTTPSTKKKKKINFTCLGTHVACRPPPATGPCSLCCPRQPARRSSVLSGLRFCRSPTSHAVAFLYVRHSISLLCSATSELSVPPSSPPPTPAPSRLGPRHGPPAPRSHIAMRLVWPPRAFALPRQGTAPRPHLTCALSCSGLLSLLDSVFLDLAGWAPVVLAARATPRAP